MKECKRCCCPCSFKNTTSIQVWEWDKGPDCLKAYSDNGGDEDGLILIPKGEEAPWWLERVYDVYGDPQKILLDTGETLIIWAHA